MVDLGTTFVHRGLEDFCVAGELRNPRHSLGCRSFDGAPVRSIGPLRGTSKQGPTTQTNKQKNNANLKPLGAQGCQGMTESALTIGPAGPGGRPLCQSRGMSGAGTYNYDEDNISQCDHLWGQQRLRNWYLTCWDESFRTKLERASKILYLVAGKESAPTTGRLHWHVYVEFENSVRFRTLRGLLPGCRIEPRKGNREQVIFYCKKKGDFTEIGVRVEKPPQPGTRTDLDELKDSIVSGKITTLKEAAEMNGTAVLKFGHNIQKLLQIYEPDQMIKPRVIVFYGKSGTGKSTMCQKIAKDAKYFGKSAWMTGGKWVAQGYDNGELLAIMDDFRGIQSGGKRGRGTEEGMALHEYLKATDRYPNLQPNKGAFKKWRPETIIFTSNLHPQDWWYELEDDQTSLDAVMRRIDILVYFGRRRIERHGAKILEVYRQLMPSGQEYVEATAEEANEDSSIEISLQELEEVCQLTECGKPEEAEKRPQVETMDSLSGIVAPVPCSASISNIERVVGCPLSPELPRRLLSSDLQPGQNGYIQEALKARGRDIQMTVTSTEALQILKSRSSMTRMSRMESRSEDPFPTESNPQADEMGHYRGSHSLEMPERDLRGPSMSGGRKTNAEMIALLRKRRALLDPNNASFDREFLQTERRKRLYPDATKAASDEEFDSSDGE